MWNLKFGLTFFFLKHFFVLFVSLGTFSIACFETFISNLFPNFCKCLSSPGIATSIRALFSLRDTPCRTFVKWQSSLDHRGHIGFSTLIANGDSWRFESASTRARYTRKSGESAAKITAKVIRNHLLTANGIIWNANSNSTRLSSACLEHGNFPRIGFSPRNRDRFNCFFQFSMWKTLHFDSFSFLFSNGITRD